MLFLAKQRVCPCAHPDLCLATSLRVGARADGNTDMGRANPYEGLVASLSADEFRQLIEAVEERRCREEVGLGTLAEAAAAYRPRPACPSCGEKGPWRDGSAASGAPRWRCPSCGRRFNSLTGTVLEHCRKPFPTWVLFIKLMRHNVPIECAAELCGVTHKTAFEWRHRVLATVQGYQGRITLRDIVWVDEAYVNDTDLSKGYGQARKHGLSGQKLCICVAIDVHKNPLAVVCGHGKPSSARVRGALGGRIEPGSLLIHDKERAHGVLVREGGLVDEPHKADVNDPVYLERMEMINNLCSWLKRYLWRFTGMSPANLQAYLDWYVYLFRVNQARDKWEPTARVVRHLLMTDATYRSLG